MHRIIRLEFKQLKLYINKINTKNIELKNY